MPSSLSSWYRLSVDPAECWTTDWDDGDGDSFGHDGPQWRIVAASDGRSGCSATSLAVSRTVSVRAVSGWEAADLNCR